MGFREKIPVEQVAKLMAIIKDLRNKEGESVAIIENLKKENQNLVKQVDELVELCSGLAPYIRLEIEKVYELSKDRDMEKSYRRFFTDESGLLPRLGVLVGVVQNTSDSPERIIGKYLDPISNNLIILNGTISNIERTVTRRIKESQDFSDKKILSTYLKLRQQNKTEDRFYINLWDSIRDSMEIFSQENWEEQFSTTEDISKFLCAILNKLRDSGIKLIYPEEDVDGKYTATEESSFGYDIPAVVRVQDDWIYQKCYKHLNINHESNNN